MISGHTPRINSSFEFARRLQARGHRISYATYSFLQSKIEEKGFECIGIQWGHSVTSKSEYKYFKNLRFWQKVLKFSDLLQWRRKIIQRFISNTELDEALEKLKPDLLLIDLEMQPYVIATMHLRIPTVLFFDLFSVWKAPGIPPLNSSLVPDENWHDKMLVEWLWFRWSIERFRDATRSRISSFGTDWTSVLKVLARHKHFPFRKETDFSHWLTPFVFRSIPVMTANALEMEFSTTPPKNVHYVGPFIPLVKNQGWTNNQFDRILGKIVQKRREELPVRPLIYCSISTFVKADNGFLNKVIQVFESRKDWDMILGLGNKVKVQDLGPIPSNVFAFEWAPQLRVLEHADCAITHGGTTSINECIYFGVPMLVYSTKTMDHNGNAARVAYHRLGIVADKDKDTVEDIIHNIELVLTDLNIKTNVLKMREVYLSYEKSNRAVSFVENFIEESSDDKQC